MNRDTNTRPFLGYTPHECRNRCAFGLVREYRSLTKKRLRLFRQSCLICRTDCIKSGTVGYGRITWGRAVRAWGSDTLGGLNQPSPHQLFRLFSRCPAVLSGELGCSMKPAHAYFTRRIFLTCSTTCGGWTMMRSATAWSSSPDTGSITQRAFCASTMSSGSLMAFE